MKNYSKPSEIRVAVVGYGGSFNMGKIHLNECRNAGMIPTAVTDMDPKRLGAATQDFPGIETYSSLGELLKKSTSNLVIIITPHNTHAKLALQCLNAGRHVVCEKPLAITTEECDAMNAAAKQNNVMLSTYHNRHWDGRILNALKLIRTGAIGEVVRVEVHTGAWGNPGDWWRASKTISGGILYDWGVHLLEYALQVIRSDMSEVSGFTKKGFWENKTSWKKDTNEDEAFVTIRFKSGQWATLSISSLDSKPKEGMMEITGTKGSILLDWGQWTLITHEDQVLVNRKGRNPDDESFRYYKNIANHLTKGEKLVITTEWARRPIHIIDLAQKSAKLGKALPVKYK